MPENNLSQKCHINTYLTEVEKDSIRQNVCRNLSVACENNGDFYCILHCPRINKDIEKFKEIFDERIKNKESDYRSVFFPNTIEFNHFTFDFPLNFQYAVFAGRVFLHKMALSNAYFRYALFNSEVFFNTTGVSGFADFFGAIFEGEVKFINCYFKESTFQYAKFNEETKFTYSRFEKETDFSYTEFKAEANFWLATFESSVNFESAKFYESAKVSFGNVSFNGRCNFKKVLFEGYVSFEGSQLNEVFKGDSVLLDLQKAQLEKPERISFHTVRLNPSWFINVDPRKFIFTDIKWDSQRVKSEVSNINEKFFEHKIFNTHRLLTISYRQLAVNAEENNRFEEASNFRKMAFEVERLERKENRKTWLNKLKASFNSDIYCSSFFSNIRIATKKCWFTIKTFPSDLLHFLYRIFSGYGERWFRAFCWLIAIWLFLAFLYATPICNFIEKEKYGFSYWIGYSLNVITLQRPEPKAANSFTMIILGLEVLFAPLQAALLILAVRRKFMR